MKQIRQTILLYVRSNAAVLTGGETGMGKEPVTQTIHREYFARHDARQGKESHPFVAVSCGTIVELLLEAELFGCEEGVFTGLQRGGRARLFEVAHDGTLFLDEIGEMSLPLWAHLLRVLEGKEVTRVDGHQPVPVDMQVISVTHYDLEENTRQGQFRRDLFYRLSILRLQLPLLHEQVADIPPLTESFLRVSLTALSAPFFAALRRGLQASETVLVYCDWPGNIRKLYNMMERLALFLSVGSTPDLMPQSM